MNYFLKIALMFVFIPVALLLGVRSNFYLIKIYRTC